MMLNKFFYTSILILISIFLTSVFSPYAFAQSPIELAVTPPSAYIKVKQGSTATHTVVIENVSEQLLTIKPKIVDFSSNNQNGVPILSDTTRFPYFDFDQDSLQPITLPSKGKAELALKITVPSGVPNQEFPLTVLFESTPDTDFSVSAGETSVRSTIGSNLIVLVSSETAVATQLGITSFKTSGIVDSFRPITFTPVVTNTGYAATAASGSAKITDWQGKTVAEFVIRPVVVLGNSSRELEASSSTEAYTSVFRYKPLILLGMYKIQVDLTIQNQDQPIHLLQTKTIIALPISLVVVCFLIPFCWFGYKQYIRTT